MLNDAELRDIFARTDLTKTDKLLVCLAVDADTPKEVKQVIALASAHGLRGAKSWNVSSFLSRSRGRASRVASGWVLTKAGREHISSLGLSRSPIITHSSAALRRHTERLGHPDTRAFVEQAIGCFEAHFYRAAVVLTWVGAISLLYDEVLANHLATFNAEGLRRNSKYRAAKTRDDLARLKESDFLDYLEGASVIGKSVRKELGVCLDLRNGCGHPNSLQIGEHRVASHIETLILNVYANF